MGKDSKGNRDGFLRVNFLYQAAQTALKTNPQNLEAVRFYTSTLKSVARKNVLRLHPSIKRTLCKKCCMLLVPGVTCSVRYKSKRQPHTVVTCLECRTLKRFLQRPGHKLWSERPEAWAGLCPLPVAEAEEGDEEEKKEKPECSILCDKPPTGSCEKETANTMHNIEDPVVCVDLSNQHIPQAKKATDNDNFSETNNKDSNSTTEIVRSTEQEAKTVCVTPSNVSPQCIKGTVFTLVQESCES